MTSGQDAEVVCERVSGARILMVRLAIDFKVMRYGSRVVLASELVLIDEEEVALVRCRAAAGRRRLRPTSTRYFLNEEVCSWAGVGLCS
jgi:hypothetical protein